MTLESMDKYTANTTEYCDIIVAFATGNPSLVSHTGQDFSGHILLAGAHVMDINQQSMQNNLYRLPNKASDSAWSNNYHVYDLEWRSGQITIKVDGEQYGEQQVPALYDTPVSNKCLITDWQYYLKILICDSWPTQALFV